MAILIPDKFYSSEEGFQTETHIFLKLFLCPHCNKIGYLILHGFLRNSRTLAIRGHRIFCSNRSLKKGCGKTYSCLKADTLMHRTITAEDFWTFLLLFSFNNNKIKSMGDTNFTCRESTVYNLFRVFTHNQSHIRTHFHKALKPPDITDTNPVIQTINHLKLFSSEKLSPISFFQYHFQEHFLKNTMVPATI